MYKAYKTTFEKALESPTIENCSLAIKIARGLDAEIMDPTDKLLYSSLKAAVAGRTSSALNTFRCSELEDWNNK